MKTRVAVLGLASRSSAAASAPSSGPEPSRSSPSPAISLAAIPPRRRRCFDAYRVEVDDDVAYGGRIGFNLRASSRSRSSTPTETHFELDPDTCFASRAARRAADRLLHGLRDVQLRPRPRGSLLHDRRGRGNLTPKSRHPGGLRDALHGGLGGGVKFFFTPHFALRFDGRVTRRSSATPFCEYDFCCTQTTGSPTARPPAGSSSPSSPRRAAARRTPASTFDATRPPAVRSRSRRSAAAAARIAWPGHSTQTGAPGAASGSPRTLELARVVRQPVEVEMPEHDRSVGARILVEQREGRRRDLARGSAQASRDAPGQAVLPAPSSPSR